MNPTERCLSFKYFFSPEFGCWNKTDLWIPWFLFNWRTNRNHLHSEHLPGHESKFSRDTWCHWALPLPQRWGWWLETFVQRNPEPGNGWEIQRVFGRHVPRRQAEVWSILPGLTLAKLAGLQSFCSLRITGFIKLDSSAVKQSRDNNHVTWLWIVWI